MIWTADLDRALLSLAETHKGDALATQFMQVTGVAVSSDAARNRLKRVRENIERDANTPPVPEHEAGFVTPVPPDEFVGFRLAFWDLETTNLSALMGRILCCSIGDSWGNITTKTIFDFEQSSPIDDSGLCEWIRDELERYDILISWNGFNFDQPLLNARLLKAGKRPLADKLAVDAMWKAGGGRYGIRVGSRKLVNVQKYFSVSEQKSEISWEVWQLAQMGDQEAMKEVVYHCEQDILVTRSVFNHLKPMVRTIHR